MSNVFSSFPTLSREEMLEELKEIKKRGDLFIAGMITGGVYVVYDKSTGHRYVVDKDLFEESKA